MIKQLDVAWYYQRYRAMVDATPLESDAIDNAMEALMTSLREDGFNIPGGDPAEVVVAAVTYALMQRER